MANRIRQLRNYQILPDALSGGVGLIEKLAAYKIAVFLDYDGTLTPITPHPEEAVLSEAMRQTIAALSQVATVSIVSGRNKSNIQELVGLPHIFYIGNHGFDIEGPAKNRLQLEVGMECLPIMEKCYRELLTTLMSIPDVQFEPKKLTVTIHYRFIAEKNLPLFFELMRKTVEKYPQLKLTYGKKVVEIRPNLEWNKGAAVIWLAEKLHLNQSNDYLIYIGDDLTDEDAFRALPQQGIGILVGTHEQQTYADYHLADPSHVKIFLKNLCQVIK